MQDCTLRPCPSAQQAAGDHPGIVAGCPFVSPHLCASSSSPKALGVAAEPRSPTGLAQAHAGVLAPLQGWLCCSINGTWVNSPLAAQRAGSLLSQLWHSKGRAGKEGPAPRLSPSSGDALGAPSSVPATPGEPPPLLSSLAEMWQGKQAEKSGQLETPRHLLLPTSSPCCPSGREPPSHQGPRGCRR